MAPSPQNFDPIARPYRWLEYLSFGPWLERCRFHSLDQLMTSRHALVLGDGDGRFTARLLAANSRVIVDAIDSSAVMLRLLSRRVASLGPAATARLQIFHIDALQFDPEDRRYDLIAGHFFFDCFSEPDLSCLIATLSPSLTISGQWLISEFAIPRTQPAACFSRLIVGALYRAFGLMTGLRVRSLPDYEVRLRNQGLNLFRRTTLLAGLLRSEMWTKPEATAPSSVTSQ